MSGFSTVVGFLFSFMILMAVFLGLFYTLNDNTLRQFSLIEMAGDDSYISLLSGDFRVIGDFTSSGRTALLIENTGSSRFRFNQDGRFCMDVFADELYISDFVSAKRSSSKLSARYDFISEFERGMLYLGDLYDSERISLISCFGLSNVYEIDSSRLDWFDSNWRERSIFRVDSSYQGVVEEYQVRLDLDSSDFDFSKLDLRDIRVLLPYKDYYMIDMPFDFEDSLLDDFSSFSHNVYLGTSELDSFADPEFLEDGVLYGSLFFNSSSVLRVEGDLDAKFGEGVSVSLWAKPFDNFSDSIILADEFYGNEMGFFENGSAYLRVRISGEVYDLVGEGVILDDWNHLVLTYDGLNVSFYINGESVSYLEVLGNIEFSLQDLSLGAYQNLSSGFFGGIDEFRVLPFGLDFDEVSLLIGGNLFFKELDFYVADFSREIESLEMYVKVPVLMPSVSFGIHVYYDSLVDLDSVSNIESTFSYRKPRVTGFVVSSNIADSLGLRAMSFYDSNEIIIGSNSFELDEFDSVFLPSSQVGMSNSISMKYLGQVEGAGDGSDIIVPISFAGDEFSYTGISGLSTFCFLSPWGLSEVSIYRNSAFLNSGFVDSNGLCLQNSSSFSDNIHISSQLPILVSYYGENGRAFPFYPLRSGRFYGVPSTSFGVSSGVVSSDIVYWRSSGGVFALNLGSYDSEIISGFSNLGSPPAIRVESFSPISLNQLNDGDGDDGSLFAHSSRLSNVYGSSSPAKYISIVSPYFDANCRVYTGEGIFSSQTNGVGTLGVYHYGFGVGSSSSYVLEPWILRCEKPVFAYYDRDEFDDETNLLGHVDMRRFVYPEPVIFRE